MYTCMHHGGEIMTLTVLHNIKSVDSHHKKNVAVLLTEYTGVCMLTDSLKISKNHSTIARCHCWICKINDVKCNKSVFVCDKSAIFISLAIIELDQRIRYRSLTWPRTVYYQHAKQLWAWYMNIFFLSYRAHKDMLTPMPIFNIFWQ